MRSGLFFMTMLIAVSAASCTVVEENDMADQTNKVSYAKTVTVTASMGDEELTKTSMIDVGNGFSFNWTAGDKLSIQEIIPQVRNWQDLEDFNLEYFDYVTQTYNTEALSADCTTASWNLLLEDRPALHYAPVTTFQYFAVYPDENRISCSSEWDEDWDAPILHLSFPYTQRPTQTCFDPDADILVSKMVTCQERPEKLDFEFARVGTITKIVCKGLTPGLHIYGGEVELDCMCTGFFGYLPLSQELTQVDGGYFIYLDFNGNQTVASDGTFTIWLRHNSGKARRVAITLYGQDEHDNDVTSRKTVRPKTGYITFREGGMTSFTTDMTPPDVHGPGADEVIYEGAVTGQTFKATWPGVEHAIGYICELVNQETDEFYSMDVTNNNDGTWSASCTPPEPGDYTLSVLVVADDNHIADSEAAEILIAIIPGGYMHQVEVNYMMFPTDSSTDTRHFIFSEGGFVFDYIGLWADEGYSPLLHGSEKEGSEGWKIWNTSSLYDINSIEVNYDYNSDHTGVLMVSKYPDRDFVTMTPTTNGMQDIYDLSSYDCSYFRFVPSSFIDSDNSTIYRRIDFKSLKIITTLP